MSDNRDTVSAAEVIRNFGFWQHQAMNRPLTVTHHGRARVMLVSVEEYEKLKSQLETPEGGPTHDNKSEHRLSLVLENMVEGFVLFDEHLHVIDLNRVAEAYYGVSRRTLVGRKVHEALNAPAHGVLDQILSRVARAGESANFDIDSVIHPGRRINVRAFPCEGGVAIIFLNTTEVESLRYTVEEMKAQTMALEHLGATGLLKLDPRGKVVSADAGIVRMTGFTADVLGQVRIIDIFAPSDRRIVQQAFEHVMQRQEPVVVTARAVVRSGREERLKLAIAPIVKSFVLQGSIVAIAGDAESVTAAA